VADERPFRYTPFAVPFGRRLRPAGSARGTALSAALHATVIALLLWGGGRQFVDASRAPGEGGGPGGGGGGGGWRNPSAFFSLPVYGAPPPPAVPALEVPQHIAPLPEIQPQQEQQAATPADTAQAPQVAAGPGAGAGQGSGVGPGGGGGTGGGFGGGVGPGVGPDSGGGGGLVYPPQPQTIILPPPGVPSSLRGVRFTVTFRISERGDVLDVSVDPPIGDRRYRSEFLDRMRRYVFTPAYTREGRPVAAELPVQITL
jgi:hypothetical protein